MANNNNIPHFTAVDIEKYHKGLLSAKERHDLEKAALDDPFLADALEGYAFAGDDVSADITDLKKRLDYKTEGAKVIPMHTAPQRSFKPLRAAVMILFLAGASFLIYQFGFNKKQGDIAQVKEIKSTDTRRADSAVNIPATVTGGSSSASQSPAIKTEGPTAGLITTETPSTATVKKAETSSTATNKDGIADETIATGKVTDDVTVTRSIEKQPAATAPVQGAEERSEGYKTKPASPANKDLAKEDKAIKQETDNAAVRDQVAAQQQNKTAVASRKVEEQNNFYRTKNQSTNVFRGRVTDAENNGVPFANVTNVQDNNAGTYTDARGYFNLTYPDTILNVQVRSIGFENSNTQLRNTVSSNQVILSDDKKSLSEVVLSNQKPNAAARNRDENMKLEEPEPADGWDNYDVYLVNNLNQPEDFKSRQNNNSGSVEVSFEVDKNGSPTNIKVEKSLCSQCDKEAIRLIKDGPKWKRNAKKGRTSVMVYF